MKNVYPHFKPTPQLKEELHTIRRQAKEKAKEERAKREAKVRRVAQWLYHDFLKTNHLPGWEGWKLATATKPTRKKYRMMAMAVIKLMKD